MKKVLGKSLALVALALGALWLLVGPNVFSVLSNIKFPSKPKTKKSTVEEKETVSEDKKEEIDQKATEIALEAKAQEAPVEEPAPKKEEVVSQEPEVRTKLAPIPEPQKPKFTEPKIPANATKKIEHGNGKFALIFPRGERVEYNEQGIPIWSSWQGRLIETQEEKNWLDRRASSGSQGKAFWCVTPSGSHNVEKADDCLKFLA